MALISSRRKGIGVTADIDAKRRSAYRPQMVWRFLTLGLLAVLMVTTCGDAEPSPLVVRACQGWVRATCTATANCRVADPARRSAAIEKCVAENDARGTCGEMAKVKNCTAEVAADNYSLCQRISEESDCTSCHDLFGCGHFFCSLRGCSR